MATTESENERKGTSKLDLDKVLVEEIGEFGIFQIKIIAQCMFAVIFMGWNVNEFVFTAGRIQTRVRGRDSDELRPRMDCKRNPFKWWPSVVGLGSFTCFWVLTVELLGPKYRVMGGATVNSTFALGQITLGLIAWAVTNWRSLILALYIPQFLSIVYFWTLPESIRWLMSKGKFKEAEDLLKEAARVNGKELSQKCMEELRVNAEEENISKPEANKKPALVFLVLKDKRILMRCFVSCMWWITMTFVYYGLSINAVNLTGNMYLNYVMVSAVEIPGYWATVLVIDRIGRKPTLIGSIWLCAACQVGFIFVSKDLVTLSLIIYMLGKWAIAANATAVNIYTLELYPTECRHRLYCFSSMMGRLGSITAPLTPALGATLFAELPFVLFGGMAFLAGLLTFLVPETLGSKLADTMEEALSIEHGKKKINTTR